MANKKYIKVSQQMRNWAGYVVQRIKSVKRRRKLKVSEQAIFFERMALLLTAGIPLIQAIQIMANGEQVIFRKKALVFILSDLEKGMYLSSALARVHIGIDSLSISFVEMGEKSGNLAGHFRTVAERLRKQAELLQKIVGALIYPISIFFVAGGMVVFLIAYIFPKIMPIFSSMKIALPMSTKIMIFVATTFIHQGILIGVLFCVAVGISVLLYKNILSIRYIVHHFVLGLPIVSKLCRAYALTTSLYMVGALLGGGMGTNDALALVSTKMTLLPYRVIYLKAGKWSERGGSLAQFMRVEQNYFPSLAVDIVDVGERTGTLEKSLFSVALIFEKELEGSIKILSGLIEPILMISVGLTVGFIALSIVTPIYEITNHVPH